jgi:hypothetical protein
MNVTNRVFASVLGGMVITLLTRKLMYTQPIPVGEARYGFPFPWLIRFQIPPQYPTWGIEPLNFLADVAFWSMVVGIVLFALTKAKRLLHKSSLNSL